MTHLLQHKSWHIWNKDNIERIDRDEAEERRKEEEKRLRANKAVSAERLQELRKRAREEDGQVEATRPDGNAPKESTSEHVNLFYVEAEDAKTQSITTANQERQAEEREAKSRQARRSNAYLGEGAAELAADKPWYFGVCQPEADPRKKSRQASTLRREDPNTEIEKHTRVMRESLGSKHHRTSNRSSTEKPMDKMAQLRAKRLEREREEQSRVAELLGVTKASSETAAPVGKYHSQFNPHLARNGTSQRR